MSNSSWRHHYIPQFYLKNFTNKDSKFYIYLVKDNRFKGNGKLFSPESHFFEKNGNALFTEDGKTDFLETEYYKVLDSKTAELFYKIHHSDKDRFGLTEKDMPMIQFFVAHLFWRNPINDGYVKELIKQKGLTELGIQIKNKYTNEVLLNTEAERKMIANPDTYKLIKYWLPLVLFKNLFNIDSPITISSFNPGELPSLICDNPLILRNPKKFDVYKDDFILPLSRDKVLIRTQKIKQYKLNSDRLLIDLLLIRQANQFVSTTDPKYIIMLNAIAKDRSVEQIREDVFKSFVEK